MHFDFIRGQSLKRMPSGRSPFSSFSKMRLLRPLLSSCLITPPQASSMINTPLSAAKSKKKVLFQLESADCYNKTPVMIARADGRTESRFA